MENLELRIQKLEKKYLTLKYSVLFLTGLTVYAGLSGKISIGTTAMAQQQDEEGELSLQQQKEAAGIPLVVEAEVFILKDSAGNMRGIWTSNDDTTSFAMMYKNDYPMVAMAVDSQNASLSLTDADNGKISLGLNDSIRSLAITDSTKKNNIYLGLTGKGEAAFDMVSTGNSAVVIDGETSSIDMSGDTAILALTETVGSTVAMKAQASSSILTFLDYQNKQTAALSSVDGNTQIYLNSPALLEEKTITTAPDPLSLASEKGTGGTSSEEDEDVERKTSPVETSSNASNGEKAKQENAVQKEEKKPSDDKAVNLKEYSPFQKK